MSNPPRLPRRAATVDAADSTRPSLPNDNGSNRLIARAHSISIATTQAESRISNYIDRRLDDYVQRTPETTSPVVVSRKMMNRIDTVGRGTAVAAQSSARLLGFIAKKVENLTGEAMKDTTLSAGASQAFQIVAESVEESAERLTKKASASAEKVIHIKYGQDVASSSSRVLTGATQAIKVVTSVRGAPGTVIKGVGKGALKVHLKDNREVILEEGVRSNDHIVRVEDDLIILTDDVLEIDRDDPSQAPLFDAGHVTTSSRRP